ncbi:MAG: class I SAM-dependent methyltransferase, partial [Frankiales bacterium]|nr:class I SAM-dependent methyltransferase [Frankiales bacterium]
MTSSDVYSEQDAATYDDDLASEFGPSVIGPAVDYLRDLAEDGPALEFAVGTGRIGVPLAAAGVSVSGIELSEPMIARLRRKVDEQTLPVVLGDMATTTVPGEFSLVYLVFNTLSNLRTQAEQV